MDFLNPGAQASNPKPQTRDSRPQTPDPRPQTPDPRPQTQDPRLQTPDSPDPTIQNLNPKPKTPNSKRHTPIPATVPRPEPRGGTSQRRTQALPTEGPWWGYPMLVLGAVCSCLEPFCGHLSPKVDKIFHKLLLIEVSKGLA